MPDLNKKSLHRIIDANLNRAKEGLRVCEDICRFILDDKALTRQYKDVRHRLTENIGKNFLGQLVAARDIKKDVGKGSTSLEFKRSGIKDVLFANTQRIKESIRVLEEIMKLLSPKKAQELKELRYQIYAIEKKVFKKI